MNLEYLSAAELGGLVNRKVISPVEVIDYFGKRIEKRNPSINAFTYINLDEARVQAKGLETFMTKTGRYVGPFAGVPIALKDFLPSKKGWPATHGGVKSYQTIDLEDGIIYTGMGSLGCIAVGKTNAPAFGFRATTDNKMFGPTSTPFRVEYNSGGSSGGSAAAVADGLVLMAETGDAGGSTRVPAAWCNLFGFKPSAGVIPSVCRPDAWTATHPYCCGFAATKTVEDAAILFDELRKYDPKDPISVPVNCRPVVDELSDSISQFKIGFTYNFDLFPHPDEAIAAAITDIIELLKHEVRRVEQATFHFNYSKKDMEDAWLRGINIDDATNPKVQKLIEEHPEDLPEGLIRWSKIARQSTMEDYLQFHKIRTDILDAHLDAFEDYDLIIAPVTGCLPVQNSRHNDTRGPEFINGEKVDPLIGFAYTFLENMNGFPAASVPIGMSRSGLPIGLQVIARRYDDNLIFRFCAALEKLKPWKHLYDIAYTRKIV